MGAVVVTHRRWGGRGFLRGALVGAVTAAAPPADGAGAHPPSAATAAVTAAAASSVRPEARHRLAEVDALSVDASLLENVFADAVLTLAAVFLHLTGATLAAASPPLQPELPPSITLVVHPCAQLMGTGHPIVMVMVIHNVLVFWRLHVKRHVKLCHLQWQRRLIPEKESKSLFN